MGESIPDKTHIPLEQWPEYSTIGDTPDYFDSKSIISNGVRGTRWHCGPLYMEEYVSDQEPQVIPYHKHRVVFWQRIHGSITPKGWHEGFFAKSPKLIGYSTISGEDYWNDWPKTTRYYRRRWIDTLIHKKYSIDVITLEEYSAAYLESRVFGVVGDQQIKKLEKKMCESSHNITLWGAKLLNTGKIVAGIAVINSPTYNSSYYLCGFLNEVAKSDNVMIGLIDHWFSNSLIQNIRILDFGLFWQRGDPKAWQGFSKFKSQFNIKFVSLPARLFKIVFKNP